MALTLTEQIKLYNGVPKPDETSLAELVSIAGLKHYNWFSENKKETDDETLARAYSDKMSSFAVGFTSTDLSIAKTVTRVLCSVVANTYQYTAIESYNTQQWENLVNDNVVTALEISAGITLGEKTAYNAL